ncbi:MAG: NUDIX domain-containing protein [Acutalibacteraceae bacterium]|jgi:ADP-ribose pyrophosphatase
MKLIEKTVSQEMIYQGKIINLRRDKAELENGRIATREVVEHPGGVCVAALTPENELLFVRQFRYPYSEVLLELPAGKRDRTETPLECGKRELREETGAIGTGYLSLGKLYPSPGYCGEIIHLYVCRVESFGSQNPDEDEFLKVERIPLNRAAEMVLNNEIPDAKTQVAVLKTRALVAAGKY